MSDVALIAEIKRGSPSKGQFDVSGLLPVEGWAQQYAEAGANCLSVLTDSQHFFAEPEDLASAAKTKLPILRKDFTVSQLDVLDAKIMGASAVLLIVAALSDQELEEFYGLATEIGIDSLFEVHSDEEYRRIKHLAPKIVGVNQRDLQSFEVDINRAVEVAVALESTTIKVAESGIESRKDVEVLTKAGFDAILVGTSIVESSNIQEQIRSLLGS